ncbi:MAG TPA: hypothetical protein VIL20_29505 [Sandaracinaceae bacterium]
MRALPAWLVTLSVLLAPLAARAHGRPPRVERIAFDPNDPQRIVLSATIGLIVSDDGGENWTWVCAAAFGADPTQEDQDVVVMEDGSVVVATFDGVAHGEPDLCRFSFPPGPGRDVFVVDLARHPTDPATVLGLSSSGVVDDRVIRSEDSGRTWTTVGAPIPDLLTERIALAPGDPSRIYVSGAIPHPTQRRAFVLRSSDGGETFEQTEIELQEDERLPRIVGVDPTNPDRLFVRIARGDVDPRPERLLYSDDGGATFTSIFELPAMRGFAISDDGRTVWAGSAAAGHGVWIARDGTTAFEQVNDLDVRCLAVHEGALYLCVDQLTEGFALGRSEDDGANVVELLRFQDAQELPECARCTSTDVVCPAWVPDLRADLATYFAGMDGGVTGLPRDAGVPAECRPDAGPEPDGGMGPPAGGCACGLAPRGAPSGLPALALLLGFALRARRGSRSAGR